MKTLELQCLVDNETQVDGLLYQSRWKVSSAFNNDFLLATSILCYHLQSHTEEQKQQPPTIQEDIDVESSDLDKVRSLLETSQTIWSRQCASSTKAQKAVAALRYVLHNAGVNLNNDTVVELLSSPAASEAVSYFTEFASHYDFLGFDLVAGIQPGPSWPTFATNVTGDAEQYASADKFQQMDLSQSIPT